MDINATATMILPTAVKMLMTCLMLLAALLVSSSSNLAKKPPKNLTVIEWLLIVLSTGAMCSFLWAIWFNA